MEFWKGCAGRLVPGDTVVHAFAFAHCAVSARVSSWLSPEERQRASALRFQGDRERFILSHAFVRWVLADYLRVSPPEVSLTNDRAGRPTITGADRSVAFSLAHCQTHAVVAVARGALVGVDVEHHRTVTDALGIARRFFSPAETDMLMAQAAAELDETFLRLWVCKEAFVKAIGLGLSYRLDRVTIGGLHSGKPSFTFIDAEYGPASQWILQSASVDRSYVAVAVKPLSGLLGRISWASRDAFPARTLPS